MFVHNGLWVFFFYIYIFVCVYFVLVFLPVCAQSNPTHTSDSYSDTPRSLDPGLQLNWHSVPVLVHGCGHGTAWPALLNIPTDLEQPAVIDGDRRSLGSHGKDRFVYSALSPGSTWQLD